MINPEDLHPALATAFNAGNLEGLSKLYDSEAVFVIKPGKITRGPGELRAALERLVSRGNHLYIEPRSFTRSGDIVLALGIYKLSGRRSDGSPFELINRFADILRLRDDGNWHIVVDNGFAEQ